jgi:hypothetical protein
MLTWSLAMEVLTKSRSGACVSADGEHLMVELPGEIVRTAFPFTELHALRIPTGNHSALEIDSPHGNVVIPPMFPMSSYALDARIRKLVPHQASPDPLAEIPVIARWGTSPVVRGLAIAIAIVAFGAVIATATVSPDHLPGAMGIGLVVAAAMIMLAMSHRGEVILDRRGVFVERGGATAFVAWPELDLDSLTVTAGPVQTLEFRAGRHAALARVAINRVFGLGFPLGEIASTARTLAQQHR